jgi:hypothetical protein
VLLLPPSLDDWLPADHLARFIAEIVDEHLDLRIPGAYTEGPGAPPYDPRLMVRLLLYGYTTGCAVPGHRAPLQDRSRPTLPIVGRRGRHERHVYPGEKPLVIRAE